MIYKKIPLDPTDEGAFLEVCVADKINNRKPFHFDRQEIEEQNLNMNY